MAGSCAQAVSEAATRSLPPAAERGWRMTISMSRPSAVRSGAAAPANTPGNLPGAAGHVGLREAEQPAGLGLGDAALLDDGVDAGDQLGLHDVRVCVREAEVGEDVAAAGFNGGVGSGQGRASSMGVAVVPLRRP